MTGGVIKAETGGAAVGGNIDVTAGNLTLTHGATISASSTSPDMTAGTAGNVTLVSAQDLSLANSTVQTSALQASGGTIKLTAPGTVLLDNSKVTSSVQGPVGSNGGNITIDPEFVILRNNSEVRANANEGAGGNITINATGAVLEDAGSLISATATRGVNGEISIQAPIKQLSGAIAPLPQAFANIANLYGQHCAAQKGGQYSSFVQGARDGVPPQPGDFMSSPLTFEPVSSPPSGRGPAPPPGPAPLQVGLEDRGRTEATLFSLFSGCRS